MIPNFNRYLIYFTFEEIPFQKQTWYLFDKHKHHLNAYLLQLYIFSLSPRSIKINFINQHNYIIYLWINSLKE